MRLGSVTERAGEASQDLNVTPLIDIVFILLVFFVVTTTFAHELGIEVTRPEAETGEAQAVDVLRVAVSARGEITVDGRPTHPWRLEAEVRHRLAEHDGDAVLVVADEGVHASKLVEAMDACRRAGAGRVALGVEGPHAAAGPEGAP